MEHVHMNPFKKCKRKGRKRKPEDEEWCFLDAEKRTREVFCDDNLGSSIISDDQLLLLLKWIPERISVKEPRLLFSSDQHGTTLRAMLSKMQIFRETIILIKTTEGEVFGCYCSEPWTKRLSNIFFGTGETFLFSLEPKPMKYQWSEKAALFISASNEYLLIGSGNGSGIMLDDLLTKGRTERCDTFNNDPLCQSGDFICKSLEVIGFD